MTCCSGKCINLKGLKTYEMTKNEKNVLQSGVTHGFLA